MNQETMFQLAHEKALEVLHACTTDYGFRASGLPTGYPQVWARDSAVTALGALASGEASLVKPIRACLEILSEHQSCRGLIPLNINPDTGYISTENAGAVDANLWYILMQFAYYHHTNDLEFLTTHWKSIENAIVWLEYQDMNECGLLEIPEAGNWMDLVAVRYNSLYDNVLYYAAMLSYETLCEIVPTETEHHECALSAADIHERINLLLWIDRCWVADHFAEHLDKLKEIRLEWFMLYHNIGTISSRPYYLPYVAFREFGHWCDSLGNSLAILTGVADGHRREHILRYMHQVGIADPYPTKAIHPPIYIGDHDWRDYYRSRNLNLPHQYHNGGVWPMVGGFHVAALVQHEWMDEAERLLVKLAEGNRQGEDKEWGFNEWIHGESGQPMGYDMQAWSASMYLYAENAVQNRSLPLFQDIVRIKPQTAVAAENNEFGRASGGGPV